MEKSPELQLAERVRDSAIEAARSAFMDASMRGLCSEGAMEAAIGAIQAIELENLIFEKTRKGKNSS